MNTSSILNELQAESLLAEAHILSQVQELSNSLSYRTDGKVVSYDDFFNTLQSEIETLPRLCLEPTISPGTEQAYLNSLINKLDQVLDSVGRTYTRALLFQSKLTTGLQQSKDLEAMFVAWYTLAATDHLKDNKVFKLSPAMLAALAKGEYSRLLKGLPVQLETLLAAVKVQIESLKQYRKLQQDKLSAGKDQANASWSQSIPFSGTGIPENDLDDVGDDTAEEEEIIPVYKKTPFEDIPLSKDDISEDTAAEDLEPASEDHTPEPTKEQPKLKVGDPKPAVVVGTVLDDGAEVVVRDTTAMPEKVHCAVCHRRIRNGQSMKKRGEDWTHAFEDDCPKLTETKPSIPDVDELKGTSATLSADALTAVLEPPAKEPPAKEPEIKVETNVTGPTGRVRKALIFED